MYAQMSECARVLQKNAHGHKPCLLFQMSVVSLETAETEQALQDCLSYKPVKCIHSRGYYRGFCVIVTSVGPFQHPRQSVHTLYCQPYYRKAYSALHMLFFLFQNYQMGREKKKISFALNYLVFWETQVRDKEQCVNMQMTTEKSVVLLESHQFEKGEQDLS